MAPKSTRTLRLTERPEIPWLSAVLGYGPMLPILIGAVATWTLHGSLRAEAEALTLIWAAAILTFLAGVRRGLSFRTEGGPAPAQIATMLLLFVLALAALVLTADGALALAAVLLLAGFVSVPALDVMAAGDGQAPLFFARLRPPQMALGCLGLGALLVGLAVR